MTDAFETELLTILPQLRTVAMALARDRSGADDLLQDSLMLALAGRRSFQPGTNIKAWMYRVMRNRLISLIRKRKMNTISLDEPAAAAIGTRGGQEDQMAVRELERALSRLPAVQRQAVLLVGVEGYSHVEAARQAGCRVGTVKSRLSRARSVLKGRLAPEGTGAAMAHG